VGTADPLQLDVRPYTSDPAVCVIAAFFNPLGYRSRTRNFLRFLEPLLAGGVQVIVAEGRGDPGRDDGDGEHRLPPDLPVTAVLAMCAGPLWQKERLLNLALHRVPSHCRYVVWVDGDIVFADPDWLLRTADALNAGLVTFVQPYETAFYLRPGSRRALRLTVDGFAATITRSPERLHAGRWDIHGHTGFAWAAPLDVLRSSEFYDRCIIGGGDHAMAHAMTGTADTACLHAVFGADTPLHQDFLRWAKAWSGHTRESVGYLPAGIFHLWHGPPAGRRYLERNLELQQLGFDPAVDLERTAAGAWQFSERRADLAGWAAAYFRGRREDD
jgi:hypothetical protein